MTKNRDDEKRCPRCGSYVVLVATQCRTPGQPLHIYRCQRVCGWQSR